MIIHLYFQTNRFYRSHKYSIETMKTKCTEQLAQYLKEKRIGKMKITLLKNYSITININHIYFDKIIII